MVVAVCKIDMLAEDDCCPPRLHDSKSLLSLSTTNLRHDDSPYVSHLTAHTPVSVPPLWNGDNPELYCVTCIRQLDIKN